LVTTEIAIEAFAYKLQPGLERKNQKRKMEDWNKKIFLFQRHEKIKNRLTPAAKRAVKKKKKKKKKK
jgi:hypothetical protein